MTLFCFPPWCQLAFWTRQAPSRELLCQPLPSAAGVKLTYASSASEGKAYMCKSNNDPAMPLQTKLTSATDGECPVEGGHGKEESQSVHPEPQERHRDRRGQDPQKVEVKSMDEKYGKLYSKPTQEAVRLPPPQIAHLNPSHGSQGVSPRLVPADH